MAHPNMSPSMLAEHELELAAREAELNRREAAVRRAEETRSEADERSAALDRRERELGQVLEAVEAQRLRLDEVVAAFGRSTNGIEFDALDNAPVKFVVLFIVPKNQFQTHLRTLASIAKFLNDRSVRESLASAKSADEILSIFRDRS